MHSIKLNFDIFIIGHRPTCIVLVLGEFKVNSFFYRDIKMISCTLLSIESNYKKRASV